MNSSTIRSLRRDKRCSDLMPELIVTLEGAKIDHFAHEMATLVIRDVSSLISREIARDGCDKMICSYIFK